MSEIYSGLASFGKVQSIFGFIFVGILFIILVSVGGYLIASNSKYQKTIANVNIVNCQIVNTKYNCDLNIRYNVGSSVYNNTITINGLTNDIKINDTFEIEYNTSNPTTIRQPSNFNKYFGWILIGIAIFLIILTMITTILVFKYKPYAAYTGVQSLIPNLGIPSRGGGLINIRA
jgi:hypothetical protein